MSELENIGPEYVGPIARAEKYGTGNAGSENAGLENEGPWLLCSKCCSHVVYVTCCARYFNI